MLVSSNVLVEAPSPEHMEVAAMAQRMPADAMDMIVSRGGGYVLVKFVVEWLVALVLFVGTGPLVLALAVLVKLRSPGPAFYAQTRLGRGGRKYRIIKLRTMRHGAEAGTGPVWAARDDCRITPLGGFLRATHLDELPQLWNVLRGQMALIGPRPERPEIAVRIARRVPHFAQRLAVRPGVTGLAQMLLPADDPNDAALLGLRRKLAHDLYYVQELSPLLDLKVAICTPCYFIAAAIDSFRRGLLRSYSAAVQGSYMPCDADDTSAEQAA
jgi:lipopolysaccharide/colanic/teichoic acid biosynthesis glycosyltransferase